MSMNRPAALPWHLSNRDSGVRPVQHGESCVHDSFDVIHLVSRDECEVSLLVNLRVLGTGLETISQLLAFT